MYSLFSKTGWVMANEEYVSESSLFCRSIDAV